MDKDQIDRRYQELAEKWMAGNITPQEEEEFAEWYNSDQDRTVYVDCSFARSEKEQRLRMLKSLYEKEGNRKWNSWAATRWSMAAIILIFLSFGLYFLLHEDLPVSGRKRLHDIAPGRNTAVLILSDGRKVSLDNARNGELVEQQGLRVTKKADGQLVYSASASTVSAPRMDEQNTIITPNGGQYQIELPDHSKVWLNAASSLSFPVAFSAKERRVRVSGEAYFEVSKNKKLPFVVESGKTEIRVLGTHFNVSAYGGERPMTATLLEGSVSVSNSTEKVVLSPGQQAQVDKKNTSIRVMPVNTRAAVAWKNGYFYFYDEDIQDIMDKVSRWYNVEVVYAGEIRSPKFGGTFSRYKKLSELLEYLHEVGQITFKLEGRRVIVMK